MRSRYRVSCSTASIVATRLISTATNSSTVAAHEVHRPDVGGPLAAHQPEPLGWRVGQELLELALDALLLERRGLAHVVGHVGDHLGDVDLDAVLGALLAHHDQAGLLLDDRRRLIQF